VGFEDAEGGLGFGADPRRMPFLKAAGEPGAAAASAGVELVVLDNMDDAAIAVRKR